MPLFAPPSGFAPRSRSIGLVLFGGVLLGGGIGFWLGRASAPAPVAAETDAAPQTQAAPLAGEAGAPGPAAAGAPSAPTPAAPTVELRRLGATIQGSLYATLARELDGREADILGAQIGRLLVWWLDAGRDVLRGDRVEVLYEPVEGPGQLRIQALRYRSTKLDRLLQAFFFQPAGARYGRHYDEQGREIEQRLRDGPIEEYEQITELMDMAGRRHRGVDFKVDVGTPVRTPFRARVIRRNWNTRRNGNCLHLVYLDRSIHALFLHLDEILPEVRPGAVLAAGSLVARTGNTGRSTAPHLHYELHDDKGRLRNPFDVHATWRLQLEGEQLEAFTRSRGELEQSLQRIAGASE